ncbi:extracellular solute-binding protein [Microgenomates group bacterium]|nr:extracellular solute-binding protein [Microgenomates group bacterium]
MKVLFNNKTAAAGGDDSSRNDVSNNNLLPKRVWQGTGETRAQGAEVKPVKLSESQEKNAWQFQNEQNLPNVPKEMAEFTRQETLMKTAGIVQRSLPVLEDVPQKTESKQTKPQEGGSGKKLTGKKLGWLAAMGLFALTFIVAGVNLLVSLSARQAQDPLKVEEKREIIEYWGVMEDTKAMAAMLERFEEKTGISVNYVRQDKDDYYERLWEAIEAGNGPDAFQFNLSWSEMLDKQLMRMTEREVMGEQKFGEVFYPVMTERLVDERGLIKGVPLNYDGLVMFYNRDILEEAGVEVPSLWSELLTTGRKMTRKNAEGKIEQAGVAIGLAGNIREATSILGLLAEQNNVDLMFEDRLDVVNIDNMTAAMRFYSSFYTDEVNRTWDEGMGSDVEAFGEGRVGIIFGKASLWNELNAKYMGLNMGVAPTPILTSEAAENWTSIWVAGVNERGNKKAAARQLANWLVGAEAEDVLWTNQLRNGAKMGSVFARRDLRDTVVGEEVARISLLGAERARTGLLETSAASARSIITLQGVYREVIEQMTLGPKGDGDRRIAAGVGTDTIIRAMETFKNLP